MLTNIKDLMIISLKFTAGSFQYNAHNTGRDVNDSYFHMNAFYVANCTFTLSRECAITINTSTESEHFPAQLSNEAGGLCKTDYSDLSIISIYDSLF